MPVLDNFTAYMTDVSQAQQEVTNLTFEIGRETDSQEVRDAVDRIRQQIIESFGIVHQNSLDRVNADIKKIRTNPNNPVSQIPNL